MTTVIINTDTPTWKMLLEQVKQHPRVVKIIDEGDTNKRQSYQEFKEKLASSLNEWFNEDTKV